MFLAALFASAAAQNCTVPATTGGEFSCSPPVTGMSAAPGTTCQFTCQSPAAANIASVTCTAGSWGSTLPSCAGCDPAALTNVDSTISPAACGTSPVPAGTMCTFSTCAVGSYAKTPNASCVTNTTTNQGAWYNASSTPWQTVTSAGCTVATGGVGRCCSAEEFSNPECCSPLESTAANPCAVCSTSRRARQILVGGTVVADPTSCPNDDTTTYTGACNCLKNTLGINDGSFRDPVTGTLIPCPRDSESKKGLLGLLGLLGLIPLLLLALLCCCCLMRRKKRRGAPMMVGQQAIPAPPPVPLEPMPMPAPVPAPMPSQVPIVGAPPPFPGGPVLAP